MDQMALIYGARLIAAYIYLVSAVYLRLSIYERYYERSGELSRALWHTSGVCNVAGHSSGAAARTFDILLLIH